MKDGLEKDWESPEGYRCVVVLNEQSGSRCGYIFVPKEDKAYVEPTYTEHDFGGKKRKFMDYDENYDICVHGGLTYGKVSPSKKFPAEEPREGTWLGFDTAHWDDATDYDAWEKLIENDKDRKLFDTLKEIGLMNEGTIRTHDYVVQECEDMSRQVYIMTKGKLEEDDD